MNLRPFSSHNRRRFGSRGRDFEPRVIQLLEPEVVDPEEELMDMLVRLRVSAKVVAVLLPNLRQGPPQRAVVKPTVCLGSELWSTL